MEIQVQNRIEEYDNAIKNAINYYHEHYLNIRNNAGKYNKLSKLKCVSLNDFKELMFNTDFIIQYVFEYAFKLIDNCEREDFLIFFNDTTTKEFKAV